MYHPIPPYKETIHINPCDLGEKNRDASFRIISAVSDYLRGNTFIASYGETFFDGQIIKKSACLTPFGITIIYERNVKMLAGGISDVPTSLDIKLLSFSTQVESLKTELTNLIEVARNA